MFQEVEQEQPTRIGPRFARRPASLAGQDGEVLQRRLVAVLRMDDLATPDAHKRITFVELNVHKETITVALADEDKRGEAREYGRIADIPDAVAYQAVMPIPG